MNANSALKFLGASLFFFSTAAEAAEVTISPSQIRTTAWADAWDSSAWYCGIGVSGLGPDYPASDEIRVGYEMRFDPGTDPFPCASKRFYVYHGLLRFSMADIPSDVFVKIDKAVLRVRWVDGYNTYVAGSRDAASCATEVYEGPAVWPPDQTAAPYDRSGLTRIATLPQRQNRTTPEARFNGATLEIDVTPTVAKWFRNGGNTGFLLANPTPIIQVTDFPEGKWCNTRYDNATLKVEYSRFIRLQPQ